MSNFEQVLDARIAQKGLAFCAFGELDDYHTPWPPVALDAGRAVRRTVITIVVNDTPYLVDFGPGVIRRASNVTVTAFLARHEEMTDSFSFRFETTDRLIVISGDTAPTQALVDHSRGCDVLVHEAYSMVAYRNTARPTPEFRRRHHTSSVELARKPGLLVTYHRSTVGEETPHSDDYDVLVDEIRRGYQGLVVASDDLDIFDQGPVRLSPQLTVSEKRPLSSDCCLSLTALQRRDGRRTKRDLWVVERHGDG